MTDAGSAQRGFTLLELLIATALLCAITAALFTLVEPARELFLVQPEVQDVQQRLRFGVAALQNMLANAGASSMTKALSGPSLRGLAAVRPFRIGDRAPDPSAGVFYRPDTISLLSIPSDAIPARIRGLSITPPLALIDVEPNCLTVSGLCGFAAGQHVAALDEAGRAWFGTVLSITGSQIEVESTALDANLGATTPAMLTPLDQATYSLAIDRTSGTPRLMYYDGHATDSPVVDHAVRLSFEYRGDPNPPVLLEPDLGSAVSLMATYGPSPPGAERDGAGTWPAGENCTFAVVEGRHVSRLPTMAGTSPLALMPPAMLTDGPWCPDESSPNRFDADLLRIRRIDVVLRVQVAFPWLRGSSSLRFVNPGSGRREARLVPDQEIRFTVTPRNLTPMVAR